MTQADIYRELIRRNRYGYDSCYPSNRYNESSDVDSNWWKPVDESYAKTIYERIKKKENHMDYNNTKIFVDGQTYNAYDIEITENYCEYPKITATAYLSPSNMVNAPRKNYTNNRPYTSKPVSVAIDNVIFNPPVTVVFWSDKTKTIVRCDDNYDSFDPEKGLAMAIAKKLMGDNKGKYYDMFKYWRERWNQKNAIKPKVKTPLSNLSETIKAAFNIPSHVIIDDLVPPKE